jgi:asparagine synthase (glutamine-hydrolysing)
MQKALRHRGPDGSGAFHDPDFPAHLVHTRLSILDPQERANQPMHRGNRFVLVFNGEIYNFRELRAGLEQTGAQFATTSDSEVLLALYERHGQAGFGHLRGMYAFAIWDRLEKTLIAGRDPFGIKPFYYATTRGGGLVFASEVRTLLASGLVDRRLSQDGAAEYFRWGSCQQNRLPLENVYALMPGKLLCWKPEGSVRFADNHGAASSPPGTGVSFRESLLDSVRSHLVSDVPVGLFLSGGLDSAALLAACKAAGNGSLHTFTLSFPGTPLDEAEAAESLARTFGSKHEARVLPDGAELAALFEAFLSTQDLPSIDGFNTFCVSHLARDRGIKVVLSGLGGDELLGGYPSFRNIPKLLRAGRWWNRLPLHGLAVRQIGRFSSGAKGRLAEFLAGEATLPRAYRACRSLFPEQTLQRLLPLLDIPFAPAPNFPVPPEGSLPQAISQLEATIYMRHQLLRDSDSCGMAHGVEIRVPFVDPVLWAAAGQLPDGIRYQPGKRILRQALPELPEELFLRPKKGFSLPYDAWRQRALRSYFEPALQTSQGLAQSWYQQMALVSWNRWRASLNL